MRHVAITLICALSVASCVTSRLSAEETCHAFDKRDTSWIACDVCECCFANDSTLARCSGNDVTSVNVSLPLNVTHVYVWFRFTVYFKRVCVTATQCVQAFTFQFVFVFWFRKQTQHIASLFDRDITEGYSPSCLKFISLLCQCAKRVLHLPWCVLRKHRTSAPPANLLLVPALSTK